MLGIFSPKEDKEDRDNDVFMVGQDEKLSNFCCIFHKHHPFFFCIYLIKITHFLLERCPQYSLPTYCRSSPHTSKINIGANTNITENVNEYDPTNIMFTYDHQHDFAVLFSKKRHFLRWMGNVFYIKTSNDTLAKL